MRIQFGSSGNILEGWLNLQESNGDITKPLPFRSDSVDFVFAEHVMEHVTPLQGFRFLKEVHRMLKKDGVVRIIVPDVDKIWRQADADYLDFIDKSMDTWWSWANAGTPKHPCDDKTAVETILCCHGHKAAYNEGLLYTFIEASGFDCQPCEYGKSKHADINNIDSHWKYMGLERCKLESVVAEGTKP